MRYTPSHRKEAYVSPRRRSRPGLRGARPSRHHVRVHVLVEVADVAMPMAAIAQTGKGLDWLADGPELYFDADLEEQAR
jgi:hypothetical protein